MFQNTHSNCFQLELKNYSISLSGDIIEGIKVTDINNNEKDTFESNESFLKF